MPAGKGLKGGNTTNSDQSPPPSDAVRAPLPRLPDHETRQDKSHPLALRELRQGRPPGPPDRREDNGQDRMTQEPNTCPFCTPPAHRVAFETEGTRALWDAFPVSPGHLLVIPKRHV